jgi:hypothetical protein
MFLHVCLLNFDEHFFNRNRPHSKKELASVLIDGFLFLIPLALATFIPYQEHMSNVYKFLAALSMMSIVKNEFFYENIEKWERVTHACLYVLHPILLFNFYESWQKNYFDENPNFWMFQLLYVGMGMKSIVYQIIYMNYIFPHKDKVS